MISIIKDKSIFDTECQTIVNTVNCVGVMGKGIALEMKKRYPKMFDEYKLACDKKWVEPGILQLYAKEDKWILNFPTKIHWRDKSDIEFLVLGLDKFISNYKEKDITSIAFPLLGASNGGLDREDVLFIMTAYLEQCDIPVEIYDTLI